MWTLKFTPTRDILKGGVIELTWPMTNDLFTRDWLDEKVTTPTTDASKSNTHGCSSNVVHSVDMTTGASIDLGINLGIKAKN